MSRRNGQRRGGLVSLIGSGVGIAAEYREHRQQKKLSRENSEQDINSNDHAGVGSSSRPQQDAQELPSDLPPSYHAAVVGGGDRSLASGPPVSTEKKDSKVQYVYEDDEAFYEDDEEDWQLDEAIKRSRSESPPGYDETTTAQPIDQLVRDVMQTSPHSTITKVRHPLPAPVILPQRRPGNQTRGFVRAYAPDLANCGIDQETFLKFIKNFHKSSKASPLFDVVIVSSMIAGFAPSVIAMAVTTAVQVAATAGQQIQQRSRSNNFLDCMNEELFKPAGLYAMIMKYKPEEAGQAGGMLARFGIGSQEVNLSTNEIIAKYSRTLSSESQEQQNRSMSERMQNLRLASGTTHGSLELPAAAPLIFPDVDHAITTDGAEETFKDKAKDAQKFLSSYLDRRAHMKFADADPNSQLVLPEEHRKMKAKMADANHPMWQGGLVGMVSGGALGQRDRRSERDERRSERRFERDERKVLRYERRMDKGRDLSRKQESRYDRYMDEVERREQESDSGRYESGLRQGGRRGRGGLISGLIGAAANAYQNRESKSNPPAPYGGQSNPPAPYGGSNPPAPYGGSTSHEHDFYEHDSYEHDSHENFSNEHYPSHNRNAPYGSRRQQRNGPVKRKMAQDCLYLMIVNLPSEAELAEAREMLARM
ncbi:Hypothetical protein R9X50_00509400 [Acrodontium crateriforme]|uniref:Uncharacterized protein n=1 Tax=Acrodontium crateriforme TaxID=150365 RepID=A0AAQ3M6T0_9PEZI|nr:Hypothetical protein R9X50_00509400 [Acrodontium crateriforme]